MSLSAVLAAIERAVGEQQYTVIGAVARNAWAPPRATTDIDLTISARAGTLEAIEASLRAVGYRRVRQQQADPSEQLPDIVMFRSEEPALRQVDLLIAKTDFEEEVLRRAVRVEVASHATPVATPEDLVVYKLLADRPRDREDIRAILRTQARAARPVDWEYIERWATFWRISDRLRALREQPVG